MSSSSAQDIDTEEDVNLVTSSVPQDQQQQQKQDNNIPPAPLPANNGPEVDANPQKMDQGFLQMLDMKKLTSKHLPIVYRDENNVTFLGLEKLHPFDPGTHALRFAN